MVTTTNRQARELETVREELGYALAGVAAFEAIAPLACDDAIHHALVEKEPFGRPSLDGTTLSPETAITLALQVAEVVTLAHHAGRVLSYLRPELVYVTDPGSQLAGIVPRPEAFVVGAAPHSSGIGPLVTGLAV